MLNDFSVAIILLTFKMNYYFVDLGYSCDKVLTSRNKYNVLNIIGNCYESKTCKCKSKLDLHKYSKL